MGGLRPIRPPLAQGLTVTTTDGTEQEQEHEQGKTQILATSASAVTSFRLFGLSPGERPGLALDTPWLTSQMMRWPGSWVIWGTGGHSCL